MKRDTLVLILAFGVMIFINILGALLCLIFDTIAFIGLAVFGCGAGFLIMMLLEEDYIDIIMSEENK